MINVFNFYAIMIWFSLRCLSYWNKFSLNLRPLVLVIFIITIVLLEILIIDLIKIEIGVGIIPSNTIGYIELIVMIKQSMYVKEIDIKKK